MNEKTDWLNDWKITSKFDTALLVLNSIMLGVNLAQEKWGWVVAFSVSVAFFASKIVMDTDSLIDLGRAGIELRKTVEKAMEKGGYKKNE